MTLTSRLLDEGQDGIYRIGFNLEDCIFLMEALAALINPGEPIRER
jgi:hypothetical protein